jgi:hypothetical protein
MTAASSPPQHVFCNGVGPSSTRTSHQPPCTTPIRFVCHKSPGKSTLSQIPSATRDTTEGPPQITIEGITVTDKIQGGRVSVQTPPGILKHAFATVIGGINPPVNITIWTSCT